jgi:hypothetical protein
VPSNKTYVVEAHNNGIRYVNRSGTPAAWLKEDPVIEEGEIAIEVGTPNKIKIGNGDLRWSALPYLEPLDSDLIAIAALTPADNDIIQRKAGVWTNRTPAQLAADLTTVVHTTGTESVGGVKTFTSNAGFSSGINFGGVLGASNTDLSKHISLHSAGYGLGITTNRLNYVVAASGAHVFTVNGVDILNINSAGVTGTGAVYAATSPSTGNGYIGIFAGNTVASGYLALYNPAGTRVGYIGDAQSNNVINVVGESGYTYNFAQPFTSSSLFTAGSMIRSTGYTGFSTTGTGVEMYYYTPDNSGNILAIDRTAAGQKTLNLMGSVVNLVANGTTNLIVNSAGVGIGGGPSSTAYTYLRTAGRIQIGNAGGAVSAGVWLENTATTSIWFNGLASDTVWGVYNTTNQWVYQVGLDGRPLIKNANSATMTTQPRVFVQSGDPGAAAADGDIWAW